MEKIKAIVVGCGMVGGTIVDWSYQKGVDYLAGFDIREDIIGKTFEEAYGFAGADGKILDVKELPAFIDSNQIDIAIVTSTAPAATSMPEVKLLLGKGINVLTSLADVYVMKKHEPELYAELDALGKANGATYFASGIQDVFWTSLPLALTGCNVDINEIRGRNVALIDYFGPGVADEVCVGWEEEDFIKANESGDLPANDFLISLYELVEKLGLHATGEKSELKPLLAKEDTYYETIDRHVKAGQLLGNYVESTVTTEEGITLVSEFVSKMSEPGDTDVNSWVITGNPNINIITERMQGEITTGSNIVNRIPDVINAPAGVVSASEIEPPYFKAADLNTYVK